MLRTYDDGFGKLWVVMESLGPIGVIRAKTWEAAHEIAIDAILDDADPNDPDTYARSYDEDAEEGELAEGCYWRSSGTPTDNGLKSPIAQEDLNHCAIIRLTGKLVRQWPVSLSQEVLSKFRNTEE